MSVYTNRMDLNIRFVIVEVCLNWPFPDGKIVIPIGVRKYHSCVPILSSSTISGTKQSFPCSRRDLVAKTRYFANNLRPRRGSICGLGVSVADYGITGTLSVGDREFTQNAFKGLWICLRDDLQPKYEKYWRDLHESSQHYTTVQCQRYVAVTPHINWWEILKRTWTYKPENTTKYFKCPVLISIPQN